MDENNDEGRAIAKRAFKASVFTDLFSDPRCLLQLFWIFHPEAKRTTEKDIKNVTLNSVLTNRQYNDLGFQVRNSLIVLVEAQSTWSDNIPLRLFLYLARRVERLYRREQVERLRKEARSSSGRRVVRSLYGEREEHSRNDLVARGLLQGSRVFLRR